jgi:hypothetical protein
LERLYLPLESELYVPAARFLMMSLPALRSLCVAHNGPGNAAAWAEILAVSASALTALAKLPRK